MFNLFFCRYLVIFAIYNSGVVLHEFPVNRPHDEMQVSILKTTSLVLCSSIKKYIVSVSPVLWSWPHWCSRPQSINLLWVTISFLFLLLNWNTSMKRNSTMMWYTMTSILQERKDTSLNLFFIICQNNQSVPQHPLMITISWVVFLFQCYWNSWIGACTVSFFSTFSNHGSNRQL